ncbi:MAG: DNA polymerase [Planctomycetota bacterium]
MELATMFIDMNAYFASVEQQMRPELRDVPVGVVPVMTAGTCCIATSYEARRRGVKTGTPVYDARRLCPELRLVEARPPLYVQMHHKFVEAIESCLHVNEIKSVDEVSCQLMAGEKTPAQATAKAREVKAALRQACGRYMTCSIGIAPNRFLAKVASNMQKPDGLVLIEAHELPRRLYGLELPDLPGIGAGMYRRLCGEGINTVRQLCALSINELRQIWNSVIGQRWWYWLRGHELAEMPITRQSIGHSHVLPPRYRHDRGAYAVLVRLLHKAAARMRAKGYWARRLRVGISFTPRGHWSAYRNLELCQDTITLTEAFLKIWQTRTAGKPLRVGLVLEGLVPQSYATQPLFEPERRRVRLSLIIDDLNNRFGEDAVYLGSMHNARRTAPMRISFTNIPDLPENDVSKADRRLRHWRQPAGLPKRAGAQSPGPRD